MIKRDTIRLLEECELGIKMGTSSISDMLPYAKSGELKRTLKSSEEEHKRLGEECRAMLSRYGSEGKRPPLMATVGTKMKTAMRLGMHPTDRTVAELTTDGCNMGIKSLSGYLNRYTAAEERAKDIAKKLIAMEDKLGTDVRGYL